MKIIKRKESRKDEIIIFEFYYKNKKYYIDIETLGFDLQFKDPQIELCSYQIRNYRRRLLDINDKAFNYGGKLLLKYCKKNNIWSHLGKEDFE